MIRRYKKLKEDMPLSAAKIEDDTLPADVFCSKTNVFYLPLSSFTFIYLLLQSKQSLRKLNNK